MAKMTLHIGANISGLQSALGRAKSMITGWAGALGGALTAGGMAMFAKSAIDAADAVADGSKKLGISAESYQKLSYAAEQSGASMDSVSIAFKKMSSVISDAMGGNQTAINSLAKLGVSIDDLKNKSPDRQFAVIADALNSVTDATDKAAYAQDLFGKGGMELIPMIANYKELGLELENIGGIMSDEAVAAADAFNDSMNKLATTLKSGLVNSGFVEWLADVAEGLNGVVSNGNKLGGKSGIFGKGSSASYGTSGGVGSFFSNLKDAYFGESEGQKLVTTATTQEQKDAGLKAKSDKQDYAAKAEEMKKKEAIEKGLEPYAKEQAKLRAEVDKEQEAVDASIKALQQKIAIQKLVNDGKEREAAIQEAINDAESKGALTDEQRAAISQGTGELFDLSQKSDKVKPVDMEMPISTDAVKRIGGSIGGAMDNVGQKQVNLLDQIKQGIQSLDNKTKYTTGDSGGNVWP
jgi:hypothetical protein